MKERLICLLIGYALGCIQTAWMISVFHYRKDIRKYGSGNAGTTNMARVFGANAGVVTLVLDMLKGILAVCIAGWIYGFSFEFTHLRMWAGIGAILGHNYPFYLKFKGGKGIATSIGIWLAIDLRVFFFGFITSIPLLIATKYVSLASMTAMTVAFIASCFFYAGKPHGTEVILLAAFIMVSALIRHHANIDRLIHVKENKFSFKKKEKEE